MELDCCSMVQAADIVAVASAVSSVGHPCSYLPFADLTVTSKIKYMYDCLLEKPAVDSSLHYSMAIPVVAVVDTGSFVDSSWD